MPVLAPTTRILAAWLGLTLAAACSPGEEKPKNEAKDTGSGGTSAPAAPAAEPASESADVPAWVNSSYLTCSWQSAPDAENAGVSCGMVNQAGESVTVPASFEWKVLNGDDQPLSDGITSTPVAGGKEVLLVQNATKIAGRSVSAKLVDGALVKNLIVRFKDVLQGFKGDDNRLQSCFDAQLSVKDCFDAVGIKLPTSDDLIGKETVVRVKACDAYKGILPDGAACELKTDGMTGDFDIAVSQFQYGDGIINADGVVKAADFCDANGVKPAYSAAGPTDVKTRWYPYFGKLDGQSRHYCFEKFKIDTPLESHLLFDPAHGVGGEPYCYFILIEEPILTVGTYTRMHILLNPKLFPDKAANPATLTTETLRKTVDFFKCAFDAN